MRVRTGSDSDWVLLRLAIRTPVATALGSDKIKNPAIICTAIENHVLIALTVTLRVTVVIVKPCRFDLTAKN